MSTLLVGVFFFSDDVGSLVASPTEGASEVASVLLEDDDDDELEVRMDGISSSSTISAWWRGHFWMTARLLGVSLFRKSCAVLKVVLGGGLLASLFEDA